MGLVNAKCRSTARLDGKTAIITGSNTGIGKITAMDLFKRGAYVIMACRNTYKAQGAAEEIQQLCQHQKDVGKFEIIELDLCSFRSIRECTHKLLNEHKRIDLLINNAGVMCCPYGKTEDGYEIQFASNYLGHFLLTILLLPRIIESKPARIINLSSIAHKMGKMDFVDLNWENKPYRSLQAYQQSKLCNVLFTKELHRRLNEANIDGVNVYSVHPGIIATELGRHLDKTYFAGLRWIMRLVGRFFIKSPEQGAQTTIHCAVDEQAEQESGLYYSDCKSTQSAKNTENAHDAQKLWEVSLNMVNLQNYNPFR